MAITHSFFFFWIAGVGLSLIVVFRMLASRRPIACAASLTTLAGSIYYSLFGGEGEISDLMIFIIGTMSIGLIALFSQRRLATAVLYSIPLITATILFVADVRPHLNILEISGICMTLLPTLASVFIVGAFVETTRNKAA